MIRTARLGDFQSIKRIKSALALNTEKLHRLEYRLDIQKKGFLIKSTFSKTRFKEDLEGIYLVLEEKKRILGYVMVEDLPEVGRDDGESDFIWYKPEVREAYYSFPNAEISGIAVLPELSKQGVASDLLCEAIRRIDKKAHYLFSYIVLSPVTNIPSLIFHECHGFERAGVGVPMECFGMSHYQPLMYAKKL